MFYFVWLNGSHTAPHYPLFEIVYCLEGCTLGFVLISVPIAAIGIYLASPLHRNCRIVFLLAVAHMAIGTLSRIALMYHQLFS
ncbi:hypothetical protein PENTCL1PPCAC_24078, partial [Pristionchus entomophagus]